MKPMCTQEVTLTLKSFIHFLWNWSSGIILTVWLRFVSKFLMTQRTCSISACLNRLLKLTKGD